MVESNQIILVTGGEGMVGKNIKDIISEYDPTELPKSSDEEIYR